MLSLPVIKQMNKLIFPGWPFPKSDHLQDLTDLMKTLLLPAAALSLFLIFMFFVQYEPLMYRDKIRVKPCAEVFFFF